MADCAFPCRARSARILIRTSSGFRPALPGPGPPPDSGLPGGEGQGGSSDRAKVNGTFPSAVFDTVHALARIVDWQSSERHALPDVVPYPGAVLNSAESHGCPPV